MSFRPFAMERWQSTWENRVRFNLSESGVHPLTAGELLALAGADADAVLSVPLGYSQSNGTEPLRSAIAALYPGATAGNVTVTNGSAESNYAICWHLLQPGDRVALMLPNYMQTWGLAHAFEADIRPFQLREGLGWQPDPDEVTAAIGRGTKLVVVTNPNNPTGAVLGAAAMRHIGERAEAVGAWILADEVYQGAERIGPPTPSFWGTTDHVIVVNGLSKAYGLPGLRLGWCVAPPALAAAMWSRKDYTTIGPGAMSDALATIALVPHVRERILDRTRGIIRANWEILAAWYATMDGEFTSRPPDAGAISYARYRTAVNSFALADRLRREHDVLVVPGDQFEMDHYIRFGFGPPQADLEAALERVADAFRDPPPPR